MSTPRDFGQRPWPQGPQRGPHQGPRPVYGSPPPQSPQRPPSPYPAPGQYWQQPPQRQWVQPTPTPAPNTPKKSKSKAKPFLIAGAIAAVLIVVVVAVLLLSGTVNGDVKKVAVASVQTEVQQVLVDRITGYDEGDIGEIRCNNGKDPTVKKGGSFTCDVTVRGKQHQLKVTFQDADGTYEVGLPQLDGGK